MGGLTAGPIRQVSLKDTRLSRSRAVRLPLTPRSVRAHQVRALIAAKISFESDSPSCSSDMGAIAAK